MNIPTVDTWHTSTCMGGEHGSSDLNSIRTVPVQLQHQTYLEVHDATGTIPCNMASKIDWRFQ